MRFAVAVLACGLFTLPAAAAPSPVALTAPPANPTEHTVPRACPVVSKRHYLSLPERFEMANTSHDGRLTLEQARAAKTMRMVAKNFDIIDATHKGFVTEEDIRAWYKARRSARRAAEENVKG